MEKKRNILEGKLQHTILTCHGCGDVGYEKAFDQLTILIVTWNRDDLLKGCLDSIVCVTNGKPPQVVVVDNADMAATRKCCEQYPFVTYCASKENLGFAGGNNLGLPLCKTKYVLLLNNDTVLVEEPFTCLLDYAESHSEVGVVSGKLWMGDDWPKGTLNGAGGFLTRTGIVYSPAFLEMDCEEFCRPQKVFTAGGALMLVKMATIEKVGGNLFYDHFKSYYEEVDFCHRVWIAGEEVHFIPSPKVIHISGRTTAMFSYSDILKQYYRNILFSHLSNLSVYGIFRVMLPFLGLYFGSMTIRLLRGKFGYAWKMLDVFRMIWSERREILANRRKVQGFRARSDREIFDQVTKSIPIKTFMKMIGMQ